MSSILNALKKLEQETASNGNAPLPQIKQPHPGRSKRLIGLGLIVFSLCGVIGAGIWFFGRGPAGTETARPMISETKKVPAEETPAKKLPHGRAELAVVEEKKKPAAVSPEFKFSTAAALKTQKRQEDAGQAIENTINSNTIEIPAAPRGRVSGAEPLTPSTPMPELAVERLQPPAETKAAEETVETATPIQPENGIQQAQIPEQTRNMMPRKPEISRNEPPVEVINDPAVELQAISWSADPSKRLAIINGKICREKDPVAGYVIDAINTGDVIISKGAVKGKLVFEIR